MADERRAAVRVPVRGIAVLRATGHEIHGSLHNLSRTGALVGVSHGFAGRDVDLELRVDGMLAEMPATAIRFDGTHVALAFDTARIDERTRAALDSTISSAISAALRRPVLVIDDHVQRRDSLIARLTMHGMTPIAPQTPLEAVDLLTRSPTHVAVALVAPFRSIEAATLHAVLTESFPHLRIAMISDDLEDTVVRAAVAWSETDAGKLARSLA